MKKQVYECLPIYVDRKDGELIELFENQPAKSEPIMVVANDKEQALVFATKKFFNLGFIVNEGSYDLDFLVRHFLD